MNPESPNKRTNQRFIGLRPSPLPLEFERDWEIRDKEEFRFPPTSVKKDLPQFSGPINMSKKESESPTQKGNLGLFVQSPNSKRADISQRIAQYAKKMEERTKIGKVMVMRGRVKKFNRMEMFIEAPAKQLQFQAIYNEERYDGLINPSGHFRKVWETLKFFLLFYIFVYIPLQIAFYSELLVFKEWLWYFEKIIELVFLVDIILNFYTPFIDKYDITTSKKKIAKHYLKLWFWLDLIALLPFNDILEFISESESQVPSFLKLTKTLRLLRLVKLFRMVKTFDFKNTDNYLLYYMERWFRGTGFYIILPNFLLILFLVHVGACVWFFIGKVVNSDSHENWIDLSGFEDEQTLDKYVVSFYFVIQTVTTVGYGDIPTKIYNERIYRIIVIFVGYLIYSLFSGQVVDFRGKMSDIEEVLFLKSESMARITKCCEFTDKQHKIFMEKIIENKMVEKKNLDFSNLSTEDKDIFDYNRLTIKFRTIKLFSKKDKDSGFVLKLGRMLEKKSYEKDEIIYDRGEPAAMFCIIEKGRVGIESTICEEIFFASIKSGFFGDYELLTNTTRQFTMRALVHTDIYFMESTNFKKLFVDGEDKKFCEEFRQFSFSRMEKFRSINRKLEARLLQKLFWKLIAKKHIKSYKKGVKDLGDALHIR